MVDSGVSQASLYIYVRNLRVSQINHLSPLSLLDWLDRLDGKEVTRLVLMTPHSWLTIDVADENLDLCLCNENLEVTESELVSRKVAAEIVLQFAQGEAL